MQYVRLWKCSLWERGRLARDLSRKHIWSLLRFYGKKIYNKRQLT